MKRDPIQAKPAPRDARHAGGHRANGEPARGPRAGIGRGAAALIAMLVACGAIACSHAAPLPAKAIALNRDGAAALAAGDLETAEARVAVALEYNPRFTEAWVNLGLIEMQRGNFERARADFVKARDLNPDLPIPHHSLGLLCEREGRRSDAERYYRAALKVDPGFAPARINLAMSLASDNALEEAREQYLRLTQVAPEFPEGWAGLCESLLRLSRSNEAEHVLQRARAHGVSGFAIDLVEARLFLHRGDSAAAVEILTPWANGGSRPRAAPALAWLAVALLVRGDSSGAAQTAERALLLAPDDAVARYADDEARRAIASAH